jgi:membrane protein implicated in regulation of membrane protease activity
MLYIAGFYTFVDDKVDIIEVVISIIIKPQFALPVFAALVIGVSFFSIALMLILLVTGAFFLFALSILILMNMLHYKKAIGKLEEEDEYYHLINNTKKRR